MKTFPFVDYLRRNADAAPETTSPDPLVIDPGAVVPVALPHALRYHRSTVLRVYLARLVQIKQVMAAACAAVTSRIPSLQFLAHSGQGTRFEQQDAQRELGRARMFSAALERLGRGVERYRSALSTLQEAASRPGATQWVTRGGDQWLGEEGMAALAAMRAGASRVRLTLWGSQPEYAAGMGALVDRNPRLEASVAAPYRHLGTAPAVGSAPDLLPYKSAVSAAKRSENAYLALPAIQARFFQLGTPIHHNLHHRRRYFDDKSRVEIQAHAPQLMRTPGAVALSVGGGIVAYFQRIVGKSYFGLGVVALHRTDAAWQGYTARYYAAGASKPTQTTYFYGYKRSANVRTQFRLHGSADPATFQNFADHPQDNYSWHVWRHGHAQARQPAFDGSGRQELKQTPDLHRAVSRLVMAISGYASVTALTTEGSALRNRHEALTTPEIAICQ